MVFAVSASNPAGVALRLSISILHAFEQSRLSLFNPLRGPALPNGNGTLPRGDSPAGGSLRPTVAAMPILATAGQEPMPPTGLSTPACRRDQNNDPLQISLEFDQFRLRAPFHPRHLSRRGDSQKSRLLLQIIQ
jgi:hypothetical protein